MRSDVKPPRLAEKIFVWYCNRAAIEDLHGDVEELFYLDLERRSLRKAKLLYWRRIFSLIFSYAIRHRKRKSVYGMFSHSTLNPVMVINYVKTASRNLAKHKFFTFINIFGLALGMSITLVFIAMLSFIYTYDNFHTKGPGIYRITTHVFDKNENPHFASAPAGLVQKLSDDLPAVDKVVPIQASLKGDAAYLGKNIHLKGYFTTPGFFEVFDFPLIKGDARSALSNPSSIVITETQSKKIFDDKDPMGEIISMEPYGDFVITGILKDLPKNSHMTFEALASHATWVSYAGSDFLESETGWKEFGNSYVYVLLSDNSRFPDVEGYLNRVAVTKYKSQQAFTVSFGLQRLSDIVPGPGLENEIGVSWSFVGIMIFATMAIIILIPACTNYVNLSISHSLNRMKEIGVRKVMGGYKHQIFLQFIIETILTMLMALVLSYFIFEQIRVEFLKVTGRTNTLELTPTVTTVAYFVLAALLVAIFAGAVPAVYFSKIKVVTALKGKPESNRHSLRLPIRKILITAQFVLSLGFIMIVVIMFQQYRYSVNFDFGFQQQRVLDVELQGVEPGIVRNEFTKLSSVEDVSMSSHVLGLGYSPARYIMIEDQSDSIEVASLSIDEKFLSNMGLTLLAGKNFTDRRSGNESTIIANEELTGKLNISDPLNAIDQTVKFNDGRERRIGGVVKNFNYASLQVPIGSFYFEYDPKQFRYANLKLAPGTGFSDIDAMQEVWKPIGGETKFNAKLFSDELRDAYSYYLDFVKLFGFLGLLAITVACLGLLGTIVFVIRNRQKEVSIRKVMGASSRGLVLMLSKDFVIMMLVAGIVTVPGVYFLCRELLLPSIQYYNVDIGFVEIAVSLTIMAVVGLTTILSQTLKAANTNPAENLRIE